MIRDRRAIGVVCSLVLLALAVDYWSFSHTMYSRALIQSLPAEEVARLSNLSKSIIESPNCTSAPAVCLLDWTNKTLPFNSCETSHDPLTILETGGMCDEYSIVFLSLASAQGFEGRLVGLEGRRPHFVAELDEKGEWSVYDPTFDVHFNKSVDELVKDPPAGFEDYYTGPYRIYTWYGRTANVYSSYDGTLASWAKAWYWRVGGGLGLKSKNYKEGAP